MRRAAATPPERRRALLGSGRGLLHACTTAALLLGLAGNGGAQTPDAALAAARDRWQASGIDSYEFAYRKHCPCYRDEPATTIVEVSEGRITGVRYRHAGAAEEVVIAADRIEWYWTVTDLFEVIAAALADPAVEVRVDYESVRGVPSYLYLDYDRASVGDEIELRMSALTERP